MKMKINFNNNDRKKSRKKQQRKAVTPLASHNSKKSLNPIQSIESDIEILLSTSLDLDGPNGKIYENNQVRLIEEASSNQHLVKKNNSYNKLQRNESDDRSINYQGNYRSDIKQDKYNNKYHCTNDNYMYGNLYPYYQTDGNLNYNDHVSNFKLNHMGNDSPEKCYPIIRQPIMNLYNTPKQYIHPSNVVGLSGYIPYLHDNLLNQQKRLQSDSNLKKNFTYAMPKSKGVKKHSEESDSILNIERNQIDDNGSSNTSRKRTRLPVTCDSYKDLAPSSYKPIDHHEPNQEYLMLNKQNIIEKVPLHPQLKHQNDSTGRGREKICPMENIYKNDCKNSFGNNNAVQNVSGEHVYPKKDADSISGHSYGLRNPLYTDKLNNELDSKSFRTSTQKNTDDPECLYPNYKVNGSSYGKPEFSRQNDKNNYARGDNRDPYGIVYDNIPTPMCLNTKDDVFKLIEEKEVVLKDILYNLPNYFFTLHSEYLNLKNRNAKIVTDLDNQVSLNEALNNRINEIINESRQKSDQIIKLKSENSTLKNKQSVLDSFHEETKGYMDILKKDNEDKSREIELLIKENSELKCKKSSISYEKDMLYKDRNEALIRCKVLDSSNTLVKQELGYLKKYIDSTFNQFLESNVFIKIDELSKENENLKIFKNFYYLIEKQHKIFVKDFMLFYNSVFHLGRAFGEVVNKNKVYVEAINNRIRSLEETENHILSNIKEISISIAGIQENLILPITKIYSLSRLIEEDKAKQELLEIINQQRKEIETQRTFYENKIKELAAKIDEQDDIWDVFK